ncbi:MAG: hypothetical protein P4L40_03820, partial [Terracidiphilus sp.]|nr:hypothetical protein [Terracidiphilus sp.]
PLSGLFSLDDADAGNRYLLPRPQAYQQQAEKLEEYLDLVCSLRPPGKYEREIRAGELLEW